jgi:hypothetical protein
MGFLLSRLWLDSTNGAHRYQVNWGKKKFPIVTYTLLPNQVPTRTWRRRVAD